MRIKEDNKPSNENKTDENCHKKKAENYQELV